MNVKSADAILRGWQQQEDALDERKCAYAKAADAEFIQDRKRRRVDRETWVYRHFDIWGNLLYVGMAYDVEARQRGHRAASWFRWSHRLERQLCQSRKEAARVEADAIRSEHPIFNVIHSHPTRVVTPDSYLRMMNDFTPSNP